MAPRRHVLLLLVGLLLALGLASCSTGPDPGTSHSRATLTVATSPAARSSGATTAPDERQPVLVGRVLRVTDGDTIEVQLSSGPITVRFDSIDAPEKSQPWGREAYAALYQKVNRQVVALDVVTQDRYDRMVAVVYVGDLNINAWLVQQGHAWAYRQYLRDAQYCIWEAAARTRHLGLWSLPATRRYAPWEWRRVQRGDGGSFSDYSAETAEHCIESMRQSRQVTRETARPSPTPPAMQPSGRCLIKGNISQNGRIYHVPGSPSYDSTKIDESKGERWFCSEAEARAAGWRPPRH